MNWHYDGREVSALDLRAFRLLRKVTHALGGDKTMRYLHTMVRVSDLEASFGFLLRQAGAEGGAAHRQ